MNESELSPGVRSNEFRCAALPAIIAPLLLQFSGHTPGPVFANVCLAIACLYVLARGVLKIPLAVADPSSTASESYVALGALVNTISAYAHGVVTPGFATYGTIALAACFFASRAMAKVDWIGHAREVFGSRLSPHAEQIVRELAAKVRERAAADQGAVLPGVPSKPAAAAPTPGAVAA